MGSNSTAALSFGDAQSGREILAALQAKQHVIHACIYDKSGAVFVSYSREVARGNFCPPPAQAQTTAVVSRNMVLVQPITMNGEFIGSIFLEADLVDLRDYSG